MADVKTDAIVHVDFTDKEWRLVLLGLGVLAGIPGVKPDGASRREAAALNLRLLELRQKALAVLLDGTNRALAKAQQDPSVYDLTDPAFTPPAPGRVANISRTSDPRADYAAIKAIATDPDPRD